MSQLLLVVDILGTFAFALSGAAAGIKHRLDLFGVLVLSFSAATAGGITRDLLIGAVPPAVISDLRLTFIPLLAGLIMFASPRLVRKYNYLVLLFDAAGLGFFAISGTQKALAYGVNPVSAALLGMLTGIGGGIVRDMLINEIPTVLRAELYAVAALAAAVVVVVGDQIRLQAAFMTVIAWLVCFVLRIAAIRHNWRLPVAESEFPTPVTDDHPPRTGE